MKKPSDVESRLIKQAVESSTLLRIDLQAVACKSTKPAYLFEPKDFILNIDRKYNHEKIQDKLFLCVENVTIQGTESLSTSRIENVTIQKKESLSTSRIENVTIQKKESLSTPSTPFLIDFFVEYAVLFSLTKDLSAEDLKPFVKFNVNFLTHNYLRNTVDELSRKMGFKIPIILPLIKRDANY